MRKVILITVLIMGAFSLSAFYDGGAVEWDGYKGWYQITKGRVNTGDPTGFLDGKHSGTKAYREIYINKAGEAINKGQGDFPYPEGTIIVKEAYGNKKKWEKNTKPVITVMIKRSKDSAPDTGDWEFFMGANGKKKGMGMKTKWGKFCGSCHVMAAATDYNFMNAKFYEAHGE